MMNSHNLILLFSNVINMTTKEFNPDSSSTCCVHNFKETGMLLGLKIGMHLDLQAIRSKGLRGALISLRSKYALLELYNDEHQKQLWIIKKLQPLISSVLKL